MSITGTDKLIFRLVLFSVYARLMWPPHIFKTQRRVVGVLDSVRPISNAAPESIAVTLVPSRIFTQVLLSCQYPLIELLVQAPP